MRADRLLLALVLALALLAAPAHAASSPAEIAKGLRSSPLYVDPALDEGIPQARRAALVRKLRGASVPMYAMLVPLVDGDRYGGSVFTLIDLVRDRLGRNAVYITFDNVLTAQPVGLSQSVFDRVSLATDVGQFEGDTSGEPVVDKFERFVEAYDDPNLKDRAAAVQAKQGRFDDTSSSVDDDKDDSWVGDTLIIIGILGVLAFGAVLLIRLTGRRSGGRPSPSGPVLPDAVLEHAGRSQDARLREEVERRLLAFADEADRDPTPSNAQAQEHEQQALDAYAAARKLLTDDATTMELVAALVLAHAGDEHLKVADAITEGRRPQDVGRLCFYDPRHGNADRPVVLKDDVKVPACGRCAADRRRNRPPQVLRDGPDPWFETDSLWARTGLGWWDDDLAARVLRGEARN